MAKVKLEDQIKELERELAMRRKTYPKWVEEGRMDKLKADELISTHAAATASLRMLSQYREVVANAIKRAKEAEKDEAVKNIKGEFPGAKLTDVRDSEEAA